MGSPNNGHQEEFSDLKIETIMNECARKEILKWKNIYA